MSRRVAVVAIAALVLSTTACGPADDPDEQVLTVFAASSLTASFRAIGEAFSAEHPDVRVRFSFAGSSDLVTQVEHGAPADVVATADEPTMDRIASDGLIAGEPRRFATNTLTVAVPRGNPARIERFADLQDPGVGVVVCAPEVPCGAAAVRLERAAGVDLAPVSEERTVTDVLAKVAAGEADAGLVYVTDVAGSDDVEAVDVPEASAVVNAYPIGVIDGTEQVGPAEAFVDFVLGPTGRRVLADAGFGSP